MNQEREDEKLPPLPKGVEPVWPAVGEVHGEVEPITVDVRGLTSTVPPADTPRV